MITFKEYLAEIAIKGKPAKDVLITIDADYVCEEKDEYVCKDNLAKYNIQIKKTSRSSADLTGTKENLIKFMIVSGYEDLEELYPELFN